MSPDPVNDHCAVRVILREAAIGEMLPLDALWRRERLHLAKWKDRADEWRTKVKQTLEAEEPGDLDHFAILDRAKRVALTCAREVLGVTGGRLRPSVPNLSNDERRLQARLRLLRVVRSLGRPGVCSLGRSRRKGANILRPRSSTDNKSIQ